MWKRINTEGANGLDLFLAVTGALLLVALALIVYFYSRGLKSSPRELFLILFIKFIEYSAFAVGIVAFVLYLSHDVGLTDVSAGSYVGIWMVAISGLIMLVGAVCDVIGIKRMLLVGVAALLIGSFSLPILDDALLVTPLGFLPLAFGIAITGPVLRSSSSATN